MFHLAVLFSCLALCCSHAVLPHLPLIVPAVQSVHVPLVAPYHGYGHGLWGHGWLAKPLGHHILKRSPHFVEPLAHGHGLGHVGHIAPFVAPVAHVDPLAVSHQSRVDVRTAPAVAAVSVVKPVIAPVEAAPLATSFHGVGHYGAGHGGYLGGLGGYGGGLEHLGGLGHFGGVGHLGGLGHLGHGGYALGHGHFGAAHGHLGHY